MKERKVKVAVIGAGTAGLSAFREALGENPNCVLINGGPYGTTCARVGCMPSKVFIQAANDYYHRRDFAKKGIRNSDRLSLDRRELLKYVRSLRDYFVSGVLKSIEQLGDKNIPGFARFVEPNVLEFEDQKIIAEAVVIATGSSPVVPKPWRDYGDRVITTDDIFEEETLNDDMAVIGGGVIGLELGQALSRMGINIEMVEGSENIGGLTDPAVNRYAVETLREEFNLSLGQSAELALKGDQLELCRNGDRQKFDKALIAVGRSPNISRLELDKIGVPLDEKGRPEVDYSTMQIKDMPIFIAGDVNGYRPFLHEVADEGRIAGYNAVRNDNRCFKRRTPLTIAFTGPQIVMAGKQYREIEEVPHIIGEANFESQGRARIMGENRGILRIYAEPRRGKLLGAEMMAPEGEYIGHLLAWSIQQGLTAFEVLNMPFYHPTVVEGLRTAIRDVVAQVESPRPETELAPCGGLPVE
ncbi:MAG: dihydrolipoyl dehydrogenase [Candidatus Erginobacter occultus]|nr:dihydrolipoyl dehydrogenase [Candidatus Erginobacter occultus]